jgi:hypothetical protein
MADELTAFLAGVLGYIAVLGALGVVIISILELDGVTTAPSGPGLRFDWAAVEGPTRISAIDGDRVAGRNRPPLRGSVATR